MRTEQLRIRIKPDGKVEIKAEGIKGEGCLSVIRPFEEALGGVSENMEHTSEFYEKEETEISQDTTLKEEQL